MRVLAIVVAVVIAAAAAFFLVGRSDDGESSSAPDSVAVATGGDTADPGGEPPAARANARAADPAFRARDIPALESTAALPEHLDESAIRPEHRERFAAVAAEDPEVPVLLDYKLRFLSRVRSCLAEHTMSTGHVRAFFHYQVDPTTGAATGASIELIDSNLADTDDQAVLTCFEEAHVDQTMTLPNYAEAEYHWATRVDLPVEDDKAYSWFRPAPAE